MLVIGLTGGIGAGKTTVAACFATLNVPIIDADLIARELTQPQQPAYQAIVEHFGRTFLLPEQTQDPPIDRSKLRQHIFADTNARLWLEQLLHPLILSAIKARIAQLTTQAAAPYCIVVIPLLFETNGLETNRYAFIDKILLVDTTLAHQLSRASQRDQTHAEQIQAILNTQVGRDERLKRADDIITNDADIAHLLHQVHALHQKYSAGQH